MITVQFEICHGGCGNEIAFLTDGREGIADTTHLEYSDVPGETEAGEIWRDGLSIVVSCPTMRDGSRCGNEIVFDGDGATVLPDMVLGGHEILAEVP